MRCGKRRWRRSPGWWTSLSTATSAPDGCRAALASEAGQYARPSPDLHSVPSAEAYSFLACFRLTGYYGRAASGKPMRDRRREYLEAYQVWQAQLQALHGVLLEGRRLEPPKLKALLNRGAR